MDRKNKILFLNATSYFYNATQRHVSQDLFDQLTYMIEFLDEYLSKRKKLIIYENSLHSYGLAQKLQHYGKTLQSKPFPLTAPIETFSQKVAPIASQIYIVDNLSQGYPISDETYPEYRAFNFRELWRLRSLDKISPMYVVGRNELIELNFEGKEELSDVLFNPQISIPDIHDHTSLKNIPLHKAKKFETYRG